MKFILINAGERAEVIELPHMNTIDYVTMKEILGFDSPVTVIERKIGDNYYDLWLDDEGLYKKDRFISGVLVDIEHSGAKELLVGNMLILKHDEEGNSIGLANEDIEEIMKQRNITNTDDFHKFNKEETDKDIVLEYLGWGKVKIKAHSDWLMYTL